MDESVWETKGDGTVVRKQPPGGVVVVYKYTINSGIVPPGR